MKSSLPPWLTVIIYINDGKNVQLYLNVVLVTPHGYPLEEHLVQTSDGCVLSACKRVLMSLAAALRTGE